MSERSLYYLSGGTGLYQIRLSKDEWWPAKLRRHFTQKKYGYLTFLLFVTDFKGALYLLMSACLYLFNRILQFWLKTHISCYQKAPFEFFFPQLKKSILFIPFSSAKIFHFFQHYTLWWQNLHHPSLITR